ncbi:RecQ family ATP-dependent DNA helicase [Atopobiaceae bacterium 24-176]
MTHASTPEDVLKDVFGYDSFRPHQLEIVEAALAGTDVLAVMPTSAGKSICYQVPAMLLEGVAVVVSPLISLMADQVAALEACGVEAAYLNSTLSGAEQKDVLDRVEGDLDLLYVAPERLCDPRLVTAVARRGCSLVAVDEAHCISQWGADFRPDYLRIREAVDAIAAAQGARPPIMALTATATDAVRADIAASLGLVDPLRVVASFDRPNLAFSCERFSNERQRTDWVISYVRARPDASGIVYCATRKQVDSLHDALRAAGIRAARYHAGMSEQERAQAQDDFTHDRCCCVVATNAFGMGIDKSDVSYVLHRSLPLTLEAYYQEAGRAGRDGSPAECVLLYRDADLSTARFLISHGCDAADGDPAAKARLEAAYGRLEAMRRYAVSETCLRRRILAYFGEEAPERCAGGVEACGVCRAAAAREAAKTADEDRATDALKALSCVARLQCQGRLQGRARVCATLVGSRAADVLDRGLDRLSTYGLLSSLGTVGTDRLIDLLVDRGLLAFTAEERPVLYLTERGSAFLREPEPFAAAPVARAPQVAATGRPRSFGNGAGPVDEALFQRLREVRRELAGDSPAYVVATNACLEEICRRRPTTREELLQVPGMGRRKVERYGDELLEAVRSHA